MKKWKTVSLVLGMCTALLAGCGGGNNGNNADPKPSAAPTQQASQPSAAPEAAIKGKITMLTNRTDLVDTKLKEYGDMFKAKYPEVTAVEFEAVKDYEKTLKVRMASNELPDVVMIPSGIPNTDVARYFEPLDDLGFNDQLLFKQDRTIDGQLYGIASGAKAIGLVYNKKAFEKAGIDKLPVTLDEFYVACEKLKAAGIIPFATNFKEKWTLNDFRNMATLMSGDNQYINNFLNTDEPFKLDEPIGKSIQILKTIVDKGYAEPDLMSTNWEASKKDVASGTTAMYMLGNWVVPQIIDNGGVSEEIGFIPMPVDNSGEPKGYVSPDIAYMVNKSSKNIDAAKAFVKFLVEDSGYDEFAGFMPILKDKQSKLPQISEYMAMNPKLIESATNDPDMIAVLNKAQIEWAALFQEAVMTDDLQSLFDSYNKKWKDAKAAVAK